MAHIALIDADEAEAGALAEALVARGHSVARIGEASEALDAIRRERPDVLIVCVEMPQISGYTLCNKLKRDTSLSRVPLLLVSAHATQETFEEHRRLRTRADAYGHKPYEPDEVLAALAPFFDRAGSSSAPPAESAPHAASSEHGPAEEPARSSKSVRLGEDPSVRDISQAPFFAVARDGARHAAAAEDDLAPPASLSEEEETDRSPAHASSEPQKRPSERPTVLLPREPSAPAHEEAFEPEFPPASQNNGAFLTHEPAPFDRPASDADPEAEPSGEDDAEMLLEQAVDFGAQTREFKDGQLQMPTVGRAGQPGQSEQQRWVEQALRGLDDPGQAHPSPPSAGPGAPRRAGSPATRGPDGEPDEPGQGPELAGRATAPLRIASPSFQPGPAEAPHDADAKAAAPVGPPDFAPVGGDDGTRGSVERIDEDPSLDGVTVTEQELRVIAGHLRELEHAVHEAEAAQARAHRLVESLQAAIVPLLRR